MESNFIWGSNGKRWPGGHKVYETMLSLQRSEALNPAPQRAGDPGEGSCRGAGWRRRGAHLEC